MHYYYLLRYCKKQTWLAGLFFEKDVLDFVVKFLDKYTYSFKKLLSKTSSQIFFKDFDHSYYNSSFEYAANKIRFSITPVKLSTESEVFQKDS